MTRARRQLVRGALLGLAGAWAIGGPGCGVDGNEGGADAVVEIPAGEVREVDAFTEIAFRRGQNPIAFSPDSGALIVRDPVLEAPPWMAVELVESEATRQSTDGGASWRVRLRLRIGVRKPAVDGPQQVRALLPNALELARQNHCDSPDRVPSLRVAVTVPSSGDLGSAWNALWARVRWSGKLAAFAGLVAVLMLAGVIEFLARRYDVIVLHPIGALVMLLALLFAYRVLAIWP